MIRQQEDGYWFFDLGSVNGSYLNGRRVTTSQLLLPGDVVRIGSHHFRFDGSDLNAVYNPETATDVTMVDVRSRDAVLLVSDIQGFTTLSEKLEPDELAPIIGSWYSATEQILADHGATLDKFLGDSALGYWLETSNTTRLAALEAAREIQKACDAVHEQHAKSLAKADAEFRAGAAIHLGPTAYGAFSAKQFTLLGDAVNLVFRLESLTRQLKERILVSSSVLDGWPEGRALCRSVGTHEVKGRLQPVEVFALDTSDRGRTAS